MANLTFQRGLLANLPTSNFDDGAFYLTTDECALYTAVGNELKRLGDYNVVASIANLPANGHSTALFYCEAENVLARWNGSEWIQINKQMSKEQIIALLGLGSAAYVDTTSFDAAGTAESLVSAHYEATKEGEETDIEAITRVMAGTAAKKGDTAVVKTSIGADKYSYTAYVYNGTAWAAMDGNYSAENVYFEENITLAGDYTQIGNLTKTKDGTATFSVANKSVAAAFTEMMSQRIQPTITAQPGVSLTFSQAKAYEVGTTVTPSYTASLSAGSYKFGPATGITATDWTVTDTKGNEASTATGSFPSFVVADGEDYSITAVATHGAGAVAVDNLGADSDPVIQIASGTKTKTSGKVTGYRSFFYGVLPTSSEEAPLTSEIIRGLTNGGAYNAKKTFTVNANATAKRIVVAVPASSTRSGLNSVILTSAMNTPVTDSYTATEGAVNVEGVNGATAVSYDVWVYEPASIDAGEVHEITLG